MSAIGDILARLSIEDVLEREALDYRVQHGSSGEQLNVHECPFCGGTSWKVYINRETGLGNCFHGSCQETFNTFKFVRALIQASSAAQVLTYLQALEREIGWRPEKPRPDAVVSTTVDWELPRSVALPTKDGRTLQYLEDRNIDAGLARRFHLRYARNAWFNFTKPGGDRGGMLFKKRVIIPVFDIDGTMVTFQGRDITGTSDRKYLFPPTLPGTGAFLYNGQNAPDRRTLVVCEGAFDVIATVRALERATLPELAGIGVVGTFGKHLSTGRAGDDQLSRLIRLKRDGLRRCIIMWDGDKDSWRRAVKAANLLRKHGFEAAAATLPEGLDPGEADDVEIERAILRAHWLRSDMDALKATMHAPYAA